MNRTTLLIGALGVAGVVGGLAYVESLDELVDRPARWGWQWDVLPDVDPERRDEAVAGLVELPEAGNVTLVSDRQVLLDGRTVRGHAFDVRKGTAPAVFHGGRMPIGADEVAVGPQLARALGLGIGDTVRARTSRGDRELTVVGRVTVYPNDDTALGTDVLFDRAGLDANASSDGTAIVAVGAAPGTSPAQLVEAMAPFVEDELIFLSAYSYPLPPSEVQNASSLRPVPWALAGFLAVLGVAALAHTFFSTLRRRRRDLAVLRALGFGPADVRCAVRWQAACLAAAALAVGIPLGLIGGRRLFAALVEDVGLEPWFTVPTPLIVVTAAGIVVAVQLLAVAPGLGATRRAPASSLRIE